MVVLGGGRFLMREVPLQRKSFEGTDHWSFSIGAMISPRTAETGGCCSAKLLEGERR